MSKFQPGEVSTLLPVAARRQLVYATHTDPTTPIGESYVRLREINAAISRVKVQYPAFFRQYRFTNN